MIDLILNYKKITESIPEELKKSPFRMEHVVKESGINISTFYRKLRNNTFNPDEVLKIFTIIKPEETDIYKFELLLKESLQDVKEGKVIDHKEMKKYINEMNKSLS